MKPEEIKFGDWMRILIGEVPIEFFIEAVIRIFFIYLLLMVSMRVMGKRMSAQLSRNELLAVVTLAAAIGVPLQAPDRGLLPAVVIAMIVVLIGRLTAYLAFKNQRFERLTQGNLDVLVEDSVLQYPTMLHSRITKPRLFSQLRSERIYHLGEVKRLYIEADGSFSIVKEEKPKPALSILPPWDTEFRAEQRKLTQVQVCTKCGKEQAKGETDCSTCGNEEWEDAVL